MNVCVCVCVEGEAGETVYVCLCLCPNKGAIEVRGVYEGVCVCVFVLSEGVVE